MVPICKISTGGIRFSKFTCINANAGGGREAGYRETTLSPIIFFHEVDLKLAMAAAPKYDSFVTSPYYYFDDVENIFFEKRETSIARYWFGVRCS